MPRVPVEDLVDFEALSEDGLRPSPRRIREALPPGWVLDEDGRHARRDLRVLAREGWVLLLGLVLFGLAGFYLFWDAFPRGWRGVARFVVLIALVVFAGGVAGPMITRAVMRRRR